MNQENNTRTRNRGFASMDAHRQKEIARKGGRAAHEKGTAHEFTSDEARAAGRKGGERVSANRRHMAEIGRLGGRSSAGRRAARSTEEDAPDQGRESSIPGADEMMQPASTSPASQSSRSDDDNEA